VLNCPPDNRHTGSLNTDLIIGASARHQLALHSVMRQRHALAQLNHSRRGIAGVQPEEFQRKAWEWCARRSTF